MDDHDLESIRRVHDALTQRGFQRDWGNEALVYRGSLDCTAANVPVRLEIGDLDFVRPPRIYVEDGYRVEGRRLPHLLDETRSFCYYAKGAVILDRYDPAGTILQCLAQADATMASAVRGASDADFANEFQAYWSSTFVLVDLPPDYAGRTKVRFLDLRGGIGETGAICTDDSWLLDAHRRNQLKVPEGEDCIVLVTEQELSVNPVASWPPENLRSLNDWLSWVDPALTGVIERSFLKGEGIKRSVAVRARNGTFVFSCSLPRMLQTDEFQKTRRSSLPAVIARFADKVPIDRTIGLPADVDYIFSRNMGNMRNLAEKRILLVGAGTIGGFLAHQLAQSGAGKGGGHLTIVDTDELRTANLGRHLLGVPYLHRNKAEGCCAFIRQQLPMINVDSREEDALAVLSKEHLPYDLIIDVTGEEALSLAINDRAVRWRSSWPPVLYGYLLGNGAMAQGLLTGEDGRACLKCLKPRLSGPSRYPTLRKDVEVLIERNAECADPLYIPYPVTRSVVAASLICEIALDWASDAMGYRMRSHLFEAARAYNDKDRNPDASSDCPACSRT